MNSYYVEECSVNKQVKKRWPSYLPEKLEFKHGEKPLHDYLAHYSKYTPNHTAYNYYGTRLTWSKLHDYSSRMAQLLRDNGIKKGDRVALYMQNCPQYIIGYFGIQKLGAIVVPLNPMYKEAELDYFINEVEIKGVILTDDLFPRLASISEKVKTVE